MVVALLGAAGWVGGCGASSGDTAGGPDGGVEGGVGYDGGGADTGQASPRCTGTPTQTCAACGASCGTCPGCSLVPVDSGAADSGSGTGGCFGTASTATCAACTGCDCAGCTPQLACTGQPMYASCADCFSDVSCADPMCAGCTMGPGSCSPGNVACELQNQANCMALPGCLWDESLSECGNTTTVMCPSFTTFATCTSFGCQWQAPCVGTITPCSQLPGSTCHTQPGCTTQVTSCTGTVTPCSALGVGQCAGQEGCTWASATACTGTITPCEALSPEQCASVPGCRVAGSEAGPSDGAAGDGPREGSPGSSCQATSAGCVGCGGSLRCAAPEACCGTTESTQACGAAATCAGETFDTTCDGPEDCPGAQCCVDYVAAQGATDSGSASCRSACAISNSSGNMTQGVASVACHSSADCVNVMNSFGVPYANCCASAGYAVGGCVSDTFQALLQQMGGTCN